MAVTFKKMCDRCYRMVSDNENLYAFKLIDDENVERVFKGHQSCMDEMVTIMTQLYGAKEKTDEQEDSTNQEG